ncbi:MAG: hypothetical protein AB7N71_09475 [Phycisphaerae bacterium]
MKGTDADAQNLPRRVDIVFRVMQVQIPSENRKQAGPLWTFTRENVLDSEVQHRLRENGIRVALARSDWWSKIKEAIDRIEGVRVNELDPIRIPPSFPFLLELDEQPRDQTLFYLNEDGVLDGRTWKQSRNVLRMTYGFQSMTADQIAIEIVPEVRQHSSGLDWVPTPAGVEQKPQAEGMAFAQAGFILPVGTDQTLLIAPNDNAEAYGILGGALLIEQIAGIKHDRMIFIRPDIQYGEHRE